MAGPEGLKTIDARQSMINISNDASHPITTLMNAIFLLRSFNVFAWISITMLMIKCKRGTDELSKPRQYKMTHPIRRLIPFPLAPGLTVIDAIWEGTLLIP